MNLRRTTAGAALVIGAMTIGLGTAHAEPVATPADSGVTYSVKLVDKVVVASLKGGTFSLTEKDGATADAPKSTFANVRDSKGNTLISFPVDVDINGTTVPVKPVMKKDDTVLELTAEKPEGLVAQPVNSVAVRPVAAAQDIASPMENQRAQNEFASNFGIATAVGGFVGTAIGFVVGCVVIPVIGCLPGAGIGGILGTIAVGGPTLIAAGVELINTLQAPDGTTKWADKPGQPAN
ncbi:hypothetical protein [Nocardia altamirensis]|uniref:hypothetical protein n=1 Tax=Nocardia altamirensis TaxID=472158 RepID=UPI00084022EB|nr:hypothetical protein [Nocardia altamirensis]